MLICAACCGTSNASPRTDAALRLKQAEKQRADQERQQKTAQQALQQAQAQSARLAEQRVQAAAGLRAIEDDVAAAAEKLRQAQDAEAAADAALAQRANAFSALVPLMLRMSSYPAETVLAIPAPPEQALEGFLLTRGIAAALNQEAAALRVRESEAARLKADTARQAENLAEKHRRQEQASAVLDRQVAAAQASVSAAEAEGEKAAQMAAALGTQAQSLRDAIAAMDAARAQEAAKAAREAELAEKHKQTGAAQAARARAASLGRPAVNQAVGRLVAPVAGPVLRGFGAPAADGATTGITYGAAPGAFVASPCAGRVAFAAPFRSYGQLVILECGGGLDVVLAGLGIIDTKPGRAVRAGEPIGHMPESAPGNIKGAGHPGLYVELRSHGQPVDPAPFLNAKG